VASQGLRKSVVGILGGTLLFGVGCAHEPPPRELADARASYARAAAGPAREQDSAQLRLAKEALDRAEADYRNDGNDDVVASEAYVALRRSQAAEAAAAAALATQRREAALHQLATLQGIHADRARQQLAAEKARAAQEGARADVASEQAAEEQARAQAAQQQAERERQDRIAAETREGARADVATQQVAQEQARTQAAQQQADRERQGRVAAEARAQQAMTDLSRVANVRREARGLVVTLSGQVLFPSDQATLLPASTASLDTVAAALKALPPNSGRVLIEGYTDSRGPRDYNVGLSQRRAQAVRDYLVSKGVAGDLFSVEGMGPDRPVASNATAEGRANNRRVEIVIPPATPTPVATPPGGPATSPGTPNPAAPEAPRP